MPESEDTELSMDELNDVSGGTKTEQESRDYALAMKESIIKATEKPKPPPTLSQGGYKEIEGKDNDEPFSPILNGK